MSVDGELRKRVLQQMLGAGQLHVAYVGIATGAIDALAAGGTVAELVARTGADAGYLTRWLDAAYAFELVERDGDRLSLSELGRAFASDTPGTLMPMAVSTVLGAHMAERAATFTATGERPGEKVLAERESILPLFGPMLEHTFGPVFDEVIVPGVPVFAEVDERGGLAVDLGCGNGWYLRKLAKRCTHLRGIGLDGFEENIEQARRLADRDGLGERVAFQAGDLHHFTVDEPAALIAMNRALHHVWDERDNVFRILSEHLAPGGAAVIWEPAWPAERETLRSHPRFKGMSFQNLAEHVQGNHFLQPDEIAAGLSAAGLEPTVYRFMEGTEAVIVGRKPKA